LRRKIGPNMQYDEADKVLSEVIRELLAQPAPAGRQLREADPDPWIRPCPRIYLVQSSGSQVAYFNRESAERFISEREKPEVYKLVEYVPLATPDLRERLEAVKARMRKVGREIFCPRAEWQEEFEKAFDEEMKTLLASAPAPAVTPPTVDDALKQALENTREIREREAQAERPSAEIMNMRLGQPAPPVEARAEQQIKWEKWLVDEGCLHMPRPGEPPQHAYMAHKAWDAAWQAAEQAAMERWLNERIDWHSVQEAEADAQGCDGPVKYHGDQRIALQNELKSLTGLARETPAGPDRSPSNE
jgi:hypothetical protein